MNHLHLYLIVGLILFAIGLYGLLERRSLIAILISIELMLNAVNINFAAFGHFVAADTTVGQVFVIFVIALAAAATAIALGILLAVYHKYRSINIERASDLKG